MIEENDVYVPSLELLEQKTEVPVQKPVKNDLVKEILARAPSLVEVQKNAWLYTEWLAELVRAVEAVE